MARWFLCGFPGKRLAFQKNNMDVKGKIFSSILFLLSFFSEWGRMKEFKKNNKKNKKNIPLLEIISRAHIFKFTTSTRVQGRPGGGNRLVSALSQNTNPGLMDKSC